MKFVHPQIAFGNSSEARDTAWLKESGITALLNVAIDLDLEAQGICLEQKVGLIAGEGNTLEVYDRAVTIGRLMIENGQKILVYCHEGKDRSPLVAISILSLLNNSSFAEEMTEFKDKTPELISFSSENSEAALIVLAESWSKNRTFKERLESLELI